jgi:hypothetical protein
MGLRIFAQELDGERRVALGLTCDGGTLLCIAQGEVVFPDCPGGYIAQRTAASRAGWIIRESEGRGGYHVVGPCCRDHGGRIIRK